MEDIAEKIVNFMLNNAAIDEKEFVAYKYGIQIGLEVLLNTIICILLAVLLNAKLSCFIFLAVFICIRAYAGGLHLSTFKKCTIASVCYIVVALYFMKYHPIPLDYAIVIIFGSLAGIKIISPVEDANRKLTIAEKKKFAKRLSFVLCFILFLSLFLYIKKIKYILSDIGISLLGSFIVLILGKIKNKIHQHNFKPTV